MLDTNTGLCEGSAAARAVYEQVLMSLPGGMPVRHSPDVGSGDHRHHQPSLGAHQQCQAASLFRRMHL
eukprot:5313910-Amphidinium_carterae.1